MHLTVLFSQLFRLLRAPYVLNLGILLWTIHLRSNLKSLMCVINEAATTYGLKCVRLLITDIIPPKIVSTSMELVAKAKREKRAKILASEGYRDAAILRAEAEMESAFLNVDRSVAKEAAYADESCDDSFVHI